MIDHIKIEINSHKQIKNSSKSAISQPLRILHCAITLTGYEIWLANSHKWILFHTKFYTSWIIIAVSFANLVIFAGVRVIILFILYFITSIHCFSSSFINECTINDGNQWPVKYSSNVAASHKQHNFTTSSLNVYKIFNF